MSRRRRAAALLAPALASALLLAGCSGNTGASDWSSDVYYSDLTAGSCLAESYSSDGVPQSEDADDATAPFNPNAVYFQAVGCGQPHRAQVVGIVDIPAATEWDGFGTEDGPSIDEANDWLVAVCEAYGALVEAHRQDADIADPLIVSPSYGVLGDPVLGGCLAHRDDFEPFEGQFEVEALLELDGGFDAALPDAAADWLADPQEGPVATYWTTVDPFDCVEPFDNADQEYFDVVACSTAHEAQLVGLVPMPEDWTSYRSDEEAAAIVTARCGELQSSLQAARPDLVVTSSAVGADFVINGRYLSQCWAVSAGGSPTDGDLRPVLVPPVS